MLGFYPTQHLAPRTACVADSCFRGQLGITGKKSFHSFRHGFVDYLKAAKVDTHSISALMGHADNSITTGRYGSGRWGLKQLTETIDKIPVHN